MMIEKIYLHLMILCGILCHGIMATLSDKDTSESSDFLVRKRRVISHEPSEHAPLMIDNVNYIVSIREFNRIHCAGVILSHYTVITAATCIKYELSKYVILSGSAYENGNTHEVTSKVVHSGHPPHQQFDGIALITVDPLFVFNQKTGFINLYLGPLLPGTHVTVTGWGCVYPTQKGPKLRRRLRSITLPLMRHRDCRSNYRNLYSITEKHICTYDAHRYCARTDTGAPLVVNNYLAGIHIWKGEFAGQMNPDVFIDLQTPDYREFILEKTLLM